MRGRGWMHFAVVAFAVLGLSLVTSSPAVASGDARLDRLIVDKPAPGWTRASPAIEQNLAATEQRFVSAAVPGRVAAAARAWRSGDNRLIIVLIAAPRVVAHAAQQARAAVLALCASGTANPPTAVGDFTSIPNASEATCSGQNAAGQQVTGASVAWAKKNVLAILGGPGLSLQSAEAIAAAQDAVIPSSGVSIEDSGSSPTLAWVMAILSVAVVGVVLSVLFVTRRRRHRPVPTDDPADADIESAAPGSPGVFPADEDTP
jgi:hypothetical protein